MKFGINSLNVWSCFPCYFKDFIFVFDFKHFDVFGYESLCLFNVEFTKLLECVGCIDYYFFI